jgi:hypothetical protein
MDLNLAKLQNGWFGTTDQDLVFVEMKRASGIDEESGQNFFEYKSSIMGDTVRLNWEQGTNIALFPLGVSQFLVENQYARKVKEADVADIIKKSQEARQKAKAQIEPPKETTETVSASAPTKTDAKTKG